MEIWWDQRWTHCWTFISACPSVVLTASGYCTCILEATCLQATCIRNHLLSFTEMEKGFPGGSDGGSLMRLEKMVFLQGWPWFWKPSSRECSGEVKLSCMEERGRLGVFEQIWSLRGYVVKETADLAGRGEWGRYMVPFNWEAGTWLCPFVPGS